MQAASKPGPAAGEAPPVPDQLRPKATGTPHRHQECFRVWQRGGEKEKDAGIEKTRMENETKKGVRKKEKETGEEAQHLRKGATWRWKAWHREAEEQVGDSESQARAGAARSEPNICLSLS